MGIFGRATRGHKNCSIFLLNYLNKKFKDKRMTPLKLFVIMVLIVILFLSLNCKNNKDEIEFLYFLIIVFIWFASILYCDVFFSVMLFFFSWVTIFTLNELMNFTILMGCISLFLMISGLLLQLILYKYTLRRVRNKINQK